MLSHTVRLPVGTYYWSVQAVDGAFTGSPFATEQIVATPGVGSADDRLAPVAFDLLGSVPNPFSNSTMMAFVLPHAERVQLDVFDLNGRRVRELVLERREAGRQLASWDGSDERGQRVAAGVYLYRMRAGSFEAAQRTVFVP